MKNEPCIAERLRFNLGRSVRHEITCDFRDHADTG